MSLTSQLNELKQQMSQEIPKEILVTLAKALEKVGDTGIMDQTRRTGDKAPSFKLPNVTGSMVLSDEILSQGHMVLSFYRGAW
jgi:hypothetical protein